MYGFGAGGGVAGGFAVPFEASGEVGGIVVGLGAIGRTGAMLTVFCASIMSAGWGSMAFAGAWGGGGGGATGVVIFTATGAVVG